MCVQFCTDEFHRWPWHPQLMRANSSGTCVIESCGRKSQIKAAKPLTWGVAIEVPLKEAYFPFGTEE